MIMKNKENIEQKPESYFQKFINFFTSPFKWFFNLFTPKKNKQERIFSDADIKGSPPLSDLEKDRDFEKVWGFSRTQKQTEPIIIQKQLFDNSTSTSSERVFSHADKKGSPPLSDLEKKFKELKNDFGDGKTVESVSVESVLVIPEPFKFDPQLNQKQFQKNLSTGVHPTTKVSAFSKQLQELKNPGNSMRNLFNNKPSLTQSHNETRNNKTRGNTKVNHTP